MLVAIFEPTYCDIDMDTMVNGLEKHLKWYFWKVA